MMMGAPLANPSVVGRLAGPAFGVIGSHRSASARRGDSRRGPLPPTWVLQRPHTSHAPLIRHHELATGIELNKRQHTQDELSCVACDELPKAFAQGVYSLSMQVRDYEIDKAYCQHAMNEALFALGFDVDAATRNGKASMAIAQAAILYKKPLRCCDNFVVSVRVKKVAAASVVMMLEIHLTDSIPSTPQHNSSPLVASAEEVLVFLDGHYQVSKIPKDLQDKLKAFAEVI